MEKFLKIIGITLSALFLVYLALPGPDFPEPPGGSVQSDEFADTETPLRRAYFTNATRQEARDHYREQFEPLPSIVLNHPPEEAQVRIRDQARSTGLEEIVHPFRESVYINLFEPKDPKDEVWSKGVHYRQKITIRHHPSSFLVRLPLGAITIFCTYVLIKEWLKVYA